MTGTEKQIAFATNVKKDVMIMISEAVARISETLPEMIEMQAEEPNDRRARKIEAAQKALAYISEIDTDDAATVIDAYKGGASAATYPMICRDYAVDGALPLRSIGRDISNLIANRW